MLAGVLVKVFGIAAILDPLRGRYHLKCAVFVFLLAPHCAYSLQIELIEPAANATVSKHGRIVLQVGRSTADRHARLAIFVGRSDVTRLFRRERAGKLVLQSKLFKLPSGEQELVVYVVQDATQWKEAARFDIKVRLAGGLEEAEFSPRLELNQKSQFDEGRSVDAGLSPRGNYADLAGQGGFSTRFKRDDWELHTAWNFVGSSVREEALRFGIKDNAPKVDLTDYLVELGVHRGEFGIGHVSFGDHALLLSGLSNRGLVFRQPLGQRFEFAVSAQSGQAITGYSDLLGITGSDNYISGASLGFEFFKDRPGGLRLDVMYLNSKVLSNLNFNTGEVPDAEENTGLGVRLKGSTPGGRIRGSAEFARSEYSNPEDPFLAQGATLVPVDETEQDARTIDLAFDLLQNRQLGEDRYATVTFGFRHNRSEPLYRSVAAFVSGDQEANASTLYATIGRFSFRGEYSESEDNVDDIPTILKTKTDNLSLSYGLPLKGMFIRDDGSTRAWLPENFSHGYNRVHQFGANLPPSFDPLTHVPDQVSENHNINVGWNFSGVNLNYRFSLGDQDNRQPGRANADFRNVTHGANVGLQMTDKLNFGLGANFTDAHDDEQDITRTTQSYTLSIDWTLIESLSFRGYYSLTDSDDSRGLAENRGWTSLTEITWRFEFPWGPDRKAPGQMYLRHSAQGNQFLDNVFGFASYPNTWSFNGGFSLSLF